MDQLHTRHGENEHGGFPFRSARFFSIQHYWWFSIRRGPDQGPFLTKAAAKKALIEYLNEQFSTEKNKNKPEVCSIHKLSNQINKQ